jgi:AraC family transcriptional regulator
MPGHWHEYAQFYLILEGACTDTHGSRAWLRRPAVLVFHPAGEPHQSHYHDAGARLFNIEMSASWLDRARAHSASLDRPSTFAGGLPVWLAIRLYHEFRELDRFGALAIEGLLLELLAEVFRCSEAGTMSRPPGWLKRAREAVRAQFAQNLSLDEIARSAGVHPAHLAREFRRHYRCTVGEYVRELRIEHARRELASSDTPLVEIALAAGFSDQSHFSKAFKRHTGLTPTEFRRTHSEC